MTSRGSRRLLLSGNELKERGRREAPLLFVKSVLHQVSRNWWAFILPNVVSPWWWAWYAFIDQALTMWRYRSWPISGVKIAVKRFAGSWLDTSPPVTGQSLTGSAALVLSRFVAQALGKGGCRVGAFSASNRQHHGCEGAVRFTRTDSDWSFGQWPSLSGSCYMQSCLPDTEALRSICIKDRSRYKVGFEYCRSREPCGNALDRWDLQFNTGGVVWLSTSMRTVWPNRRMRRSMQRTCRVRGPRTQGYTAAHLVETRLQSQVATHSRLKTIGSTIQPMVRSGGNFWFIPSSRASDKPGGSVFYRPKERDCTSTYVNSQFAPKPVFEVSHVLNCELGSIALGSGHIMRPARHAVSFNNSCTVPAATSISTLDGTNGADGLAGHCGCLSRAV